MIIVSNMKSIHTISAQKWTEINETNEGDTISIENDIIEEFMIHPNKLFKISFSSEQYQFNENSELRVRYCY